MNERIKEAIIQTLGKQGVIDSRAFGHWALSDEQLEKFAELIVRECLTFVKPMPGSGDIDDLALEAAREGIKEHFGVEE